jgi:hypothetical protein
MGISIGLTTLTSAYFGYYSFLIGVSVLGYFLLSKTKTGTRDLLIGAGVATLTAIFVAFPFYYEIVINAITGRVSQTQSVFYERTIDHLVTYTVRFREFFTPSVDHVVFGEIVENTVRANLHGSNVPEQTVYLSFSAIAMVIFSWFRRGSLSADHQQFLFLSYFVGALAILLAWVPLIQIGDVILPNLSYFLFEVISFFRVYSRIVIFVMLALSIIVAISLNDLMSRLPKKFGLFCSSVFFGLLAFEFWSPPIFAKIDEKSTPMVYRWLAEQEGEFPIIEYPLFNTDQAAFYDYLFWQRLHGKPLVNGAKFLAGNGQENSNWAGDLSDPELIGELKKRNVRYVLIHDDLMVQGEIPYSIKRYFPVARSETSAIYMTKSVVGRELKYVDRFGSTKVFELVR